MKKLIYIMMFTLILQLLPSFRLAAADASATAGTPGQCQSFQTNTGYFYDDYESHDYDSGYLALHFKLKTPYNDGRQWTDYGFYVYDGSCAKEFHDSAVPRASIDKGTQYYSVRFDNPTHYQFWNDETGNPIICSACSGSISMSMSSTNETATTISMYARIDGNASTMQSGSYTILPPVAPKTPILIIPGILGTELSTADASGNDTQLWPNVVLSAFSDDSFMDPLLMDDTGASIQKVHVGKVLHAVDYGVGYFDYTAGLISTLVNDEGYVEGSTLFTFPYDWRLDPAQNINALKTELDTIAALNPHSPKIDVVAHSYGGLLLKRYIAQTSDTRIGKIVFVGVPQLGSAEAAQALLFGDNLGISMLNSKEIYKLAQDMPMIYDLLPSQEYYKHTAGFFDDLSSGATQTIPGYDSDQAMLTAIGKNLRLLNQAAVGHTDSLDNMDFSKLPYQVTSIVGCGVFTEKTINKMYANDPTLLQRAFQGPKYRIEGDSGDGTVLMQSAEHDGGTVYYIPGVTHASLLSNSHSDEAIMDILNNQPPDLNFLHTASTVGSSCDVSGKLLSFSSNVNLTIMDKTTGQALQPYRDYPIIETDNDRHVFIPRDMLPNYTIQVQDVDASSPTSTVGSASSGTTVPTENISIHDVGNTTTDSHATYNYNNIKLDGNLLGITFTGNESATTGDTGQTVSLVNPSSGSSSTVQTSSQLDGSYGVVSGSNAVPDDTSATAGGNDSSAAGTSSTSSASSNISPSSITSSNNPSDTTSGTASGDTSTISVGTGDTSPTSGGTSGTSSASVLSGAGTTESSSDNISDSTGSNVNPSDNGAQQTSANDAVVDQDSTAQTVASNDDPVPDDTAQSEERTEQSTDQSDVTNASATSSSAVTPISSENHLTITVRSADNQSYDNQKSSNDEVRDDTDEKDTQQMTNQSKGLHFLFGFLDLLRRLIERMFF